MPRFLHHVDSSALSVWDISGVTPVVIFNGSTVKEAQDTARDLNDCPYEIVGFFEEFIEIGLCTGLGTKTLGTRRVATLDRKLGAAGQIERTLTEPITLTKGLKQITIKASKERPVRVVCMLQILCGRTKE